MKRNNDDIAKLKAQKTELSERHAAVMAQAQQFHAQAQAGCQRLEREVIKIDGKLELLESRKTAPRIKKPKAITLPEATIDQLLEEVKRKSNA